MFSSKVSPGLGRVLLSYQQSAAYLFAGEVGPEILARIQRVALKHDWESVRVYIMTHSAVDVVSEAAPREVLHIDLASLRRQAPRRRLRRRLSALGV